MTSITEPADSATGYAVRLASKLPKSRDANGLADRAEELVSDPNALRFGVIAFETSRIITDCESGTDTAVVRILRVELAGGALESKVKTLLLDAVSKRTGEKQPTLDGLTDSGTE